MAKYSKTLLLIASKLGLSEEEKVLSKAAEFERLLQMKSTANTNITDTGKIVVCLDLAAGLCGVDFDVKTAIKYSGLKGPSYSNSKKVIENLLELDSNALTTSVVCVALQCSAVQDLADRILDEYCKSKMEIDLNLPQYVCMAVHQACRIKKVKVPKSKIVEKSRLKPAQWSKLDADWTKFVDKCFAVTKKKGRPPKNPVESIEQTMEVDLASKKEDQASEIKVEQYEDWRRRILATAYKDLEKLKEEGNIEHDAKQKETKAKMTHMSPKIVMDRLQNAVCEKEIEDKWSPRRSPRKTPQKYEPYKSPVKGKGVRLLFPLNALGIPAKK